MISNKKVVEAATMVANYCKEQKSCQNCISVCTDAKIGIVRLVLLKFKMFYPILKPKRKTVVISENP